MNTNTAPAATNIGNWQIDAAHSGAEFSVRHLMISKVKGRFADLAGTLQTDTENPNDVSLDVRIGVASIDTRQAQRDEHLRSPDFFDAGKWPEITFSGKRIEGEVSGEFRLFGDLKIRDVVREVVLDVTNEGSVTDPWGNERIGFSASGKIDRTDFGLTYNQALETGGVVVGNEIRIAIDVEFTAVIAESAAAA
ncbi:MAG: YceI family protein [Gemmatimonadaceae bacterium]